MMHFDTNLFISVEMRCSTSLKLYIPPVVECEPQLLQVTMNRINMLLQIIIYVCSYNTFNWVLKVQFIAKVFHFGARSTLWRYIEGQN